MIPLNALPLFLLMVSATPLWAQAPSPPPAGNAVLASDRAQLATCLREGRTAAPSCIGMIAVACVRAVGVDQRAAEAGCARREEAVWRERLLMALRLKGRSLDAGQRNRVVALQVAWESFVAQKCAFYGTTQREGWQLGIVDLDRLLDARGQAAPARAEQHRGGGRRATRALAQAGR